LLPWVDEIQFEYLYRKPLRRNQSLSEVEEEWVEYWGGVTGDEIDDLRLAISPGMDPDVSRESRRFLPVAVKITLTFARHPLTEKEDEEFDLPPIVVPIHAKGIYR